MINSMRIQNFKCFKDFEVKDLGRVNLIGGKNNVGKTSLLESVFIYTNRESPLLIFDLMTMRGIYQTALNPFIAWQTLFRNFIPEQKIFMQFNKDRLEFKCDEEYVAQSPEPTLNNGLVNLVNINWQQNFESNFKQTLKLKIALENSKEKVYGFIIQNNTIKSTEPRNILASQNSRWLIWNLRNYLAYPILDQENFKSVVINKQKERVFSLLKSIDSNLKEITSIANGVGGNELYIDTGLPKSMPFTLSGDGIQRLFTIACAIVNSQGRPVLIDEIDNGFHYSIMPIVFQAIGKFAQEFNCQIFATTHSYECIKAAHEGFKDKPNDLRYIRLNRLEDDIISTTYSTEGFARSIDHEWELR